MSQNITSKDSPSLFPGSLDNSIHKHEFLPEKNIKQWNKAEEYF